jgi:hypothetical protein
MRQKQDKFKKEFEKFNFNFDTTNLDMPKGNIANEEFINHDDQDFDK